ncbi:hypothetical protein ACJIZ3_018362 [Penstemon smallii]|uniref:Uncharacterized protein n=1 Tax=Penstemon smallii TaxID=265156 RepID=A0ABD3SYN6_9LAMI
MNGKVLKLKQKNEEMETECPVRELMNGTKSFNELDMEQLNRFSQFAGKKLTKLENRMKELGGAESEFSYSSLDTLMDDLRKEINVEPKSDEISSDNQESPSIYYSKRCFSLGSIP